MGSLKLHVVITFIWDVVLHLKNLCTQIIEEMLVMYVRVYMCSIKDEWSSHHISVC